MRRFFQALSVVILTLIFSGNAWAFQAAGLWHISGTGFVEKSIIRISLKVTGSTALQTMTIAGTECLTSYDAAIKIDAFDRAGFDINVRDEHFADSFNTPVPLPDINPTPENPFTIPAITLNGLTYEASFTSENTGTLSVTGYVDIDTVGTSEINTKCVIWRDGTPKPEEDTSSSSGCNSGLGIFAFLMLISGVKIIVRN